MLRLRLDCGVIRCCQLLRGHGVLLRHPSAFQTMCQVGTPDAEVVAAQKTVNDARPITTRSSGRKQTLC